MTLTEYLLEFNTYLSTGELAEIRITLKRDINKNVDEMYYEIKDRFNGNSFHSLATLAFFIECEFDENISSFQVSRVVNGHKIGIVKYINAVNSVV